MKFFLMGLVKQFIKEAGRSPNPTELANLKKLALEMESSEKIIPFPKDRITNPFEPRPENKKSIDLAKELEELTNKNLEERGLGSIKLGDELPPSKNKKDYKKIVELEEENILADEAMAKEFSDFSTRIKGMSSTDRVAERLKDLKGVDLSNLSGIEAQKIASEIIGRKGPFKTISSKGAKEVLGELDNIIKNEDLGTKLKNFDGDPDAMAMGGRIEMSRGGGIISFIKSLLKKKKSPSEDFADYLKKMRAESDRINKEFYKGLEKGGELDQNVAKIKEGYKFPDRSEIKKQIKERVDKKKLEKFDVEGRKPNATGGIARIGMFKGGKPFRRLLQYLAGTSGKKGSQNLKDFKISDQMKFFADKQGVSADQNRIDYLEQVLESLYADKKLIQNLEPSPAKMDIENQAAQKFRKDYIDVTQGGRYEGLSSDMIDKSILELETMIKNLKTKNRKPNAMGGRIGFDKGSPPSKGRRNFLKLLGGLASIPVFGKLFKAAKPAAKVAKTVEQTTSGVPAYFPKLVEKIKMLGDDVTEIAATKERQKVTKYKDYELTEEIDTGAIQVKKGDIYSGREEYMIYDKPETIVGKNNKPVEVPAQYEEVTVRPDMDGKMKDVDAGLDSISDIMKDADMIETNYKIKPDGRPKKSGGGVAYMLGE
jgi:hypothetical protein